MTEMERLALLLDEAGVEYATYGEGPQVFTRGMPYRNQIRVLHADGSDRCVSAICHFGSMGAQAGLIECWDFVGEPEGYMTADEAYVYIRSRIG